MSTEPGPASERMALNLGRILQERNIKQNEFAAAIRYSATHLNQVLKLTKRMSMEMVDAVVDELKIDPSDLIRHTGAVPLPSDLHKGASLLEHLPLRQDASNRESWGTPNAAVDLVAALEARLHEATRLRADFAEIRDDIRAAAQYLHTVSEQINDRISGLVHAQPGAQHQVARVIQPTNPEFRGGSRRKAGKKGRAR